MFQVHSNQICPWMRLEQNPLRRERERVVRLTGTGRVVRLVVAILRRPSRMLTVPFQASNGPIRSSHGRARTQVASLRANTLTRSAMRGGGVRIPGQILEFPLHRSSPLNYLPIGRAHWWGEKAPQEACANPLRIPCRTRAALVASSVISKICKKEFRPQEIHCTNS